MRIRADDTVAAYSVSTRDPIPVEEVLGRAVLFVVGVSYSSIESWELVGRYALEDHMASPAVFVKGHLVYDMEGMEREATADDWRQLEPAAAWDAHHVERRVVDALAGRPCAFVERMREEWRSTPGFAVRIMRTPVRGLRTRNASGAECPGTFRDRGCCTRRLAAWVVQQPAATWRST